MTIHPILNIPFLPCTPSLPQIMNALTEITTKVSVWIFNDSESSSLYLLLLLTDTMDMHGGGSMKPCMVPYIISKFPVNL